MPLNNALGIPSCISPELLYALAKMGHGDTIVIADAYFPADSVAAHAVIKVPIRLYDKAYTTAEVAKACLHLITLDLKYDPTPVKVMQKVPSDSELPVKSYELIQAATGITTDRMEFVERFNFYEFAKKCFVVIQTNDTEPYGNCILTRGVE